MHEDDLIPLKHTYLVTLHCRVWKKFMHLRTNSWFTISVGIEVWIEGVLMNTLFVGLLHHASYIGLWLPIMSIGFFQPASNYLWAKNVTLCYKQYGFTTFLAHSIFHTALNQNVQLRYLTQNTWSLLIIGWYIVRYNATFHCMHCGSSMRVGGWGKNWFFYALKWEKQFLGKMQIQGSRWQTKKIAGIKRSDTLLNIANNELPTYARCTYSCPI